MKILGLTSYFHDSSACLLVDGMPVTFVEEERLNRDKHTAEFPTQAIKWVLSEAKIGIDDVDEIAFYLDPQSYLRTGVKAAMANFPRSLRLGLPSAGTRSPFGRIWKMSRLKHEIKAHVGGTGRAPVHFIDHYRTHQAAAFYASGYDDAAVMTMDFAVDGTTEVIAHGRGTRIDDKLKHHVPNGFALVYATVTHLLGFKWYDEFKVMGMAAYGKPKYLDKVRQLYHLNEETGELALDFKYFEFQNHGMSKLFSDKAMELFWVPRTKSDPITEREYDLAASLQAATNEYGIAMARLAKRLTGSKNLCMAGGVAQNCLMNQKICESGLFENVFLQPLAGDVGCSLGAALWRWHGVHGKPRQYKMDHLYLGPSYDADADRVSDSGVLVERPSTNWHADVAKAIADGLVIGYFGGRMEAGPRALGSRSILADPRRTDMKDILNSRVKHREHFRPFAPSVLAEEVDRAFEPLPACRSLDYMIVTMNVRPEWKAKLPAITHGDGTARVQTVQKAFNPNYHQVISEFYKLTGVPMVINTSFNDNEPIVCRPEDAVACFKRTRIDLLVLNGRLFFREDNTAALAA
ncbi:MAG: carbamoyltransferase [Hyphomicrobiaceae bacterium]